MMKFIAGLLLVLIGSFSVEATMPNSVTIDTGVISVVNDPSSAVTVPFGKYVFSTPVYFSEEDCPDLNVCSLTIDVNSPIINYSKVDYSPDHSVTGYKVKGAKGFYLSLGIRDSTGDNYGYGVRPMYSHDRHFQIIFTIFTPDDGTDQIGEANVSGKIGFISSKDFSGEVNNTNVNIDMNISIKESACVIQNSLNQAYRWDNISPSEIMNGSVAKKRAPITIQCSGTELGSTMFKLTADTGSADDNNGILKTDLDNLGIKLTWAKDGNAIPFNQEMVYPGDTSTNLGDYSIDAQPVSINGGTIAGGTFHGAATLLIEYR